MLNLINRFALDESGMETVEWAIVGGVITVVGVGLFFAIGQDVSNGMTALSVETALIP
jgi:Flp pilus assembly pilin Flp